MLSLQAVAQNATVMIYVAGINNQLVGLTADTLYFLSGSTPGAGTPTAPTTSGHIVQELGIALSDTEIAFQPSKPIARA